ncbi:MAG: hypothetical protein PWP23_357 [Candidatus Sumerlaeota bacterium]|nr:hypothetical protein [Candidatus Sumerlaeota bacterium]
MRRKISHAERAERQEALVRGAQFLAMFGFAWFLHVAGATVYLAKRARDFAELGIERSVFLEAVYWVYDWRSWTGWMVPLGALMLGLIIAVFKIPVPPWLMAVVLFAAFLAFDAMTAFAFGISFIW